MKAFVFQKYGRPQDVLKLKDVPMPEPGTKEVLVKIMATAINDYDYSAITGNPSIYKLMYGLHLPKKKFQVPGMELAGIVIKNGSEVSNVSVNERVFGDISNHGFGTFAQYVCIHEDALHAMPPELSFEEAVAIPHASVLALQGLRASRQIKKGSKILVNGAGGGVGFFAIHLMRKISEDITGVDSEHKLHELEKRGYSKVLAYQKTDFTKTAEKYDFILDCKTNRSPLNYIRALNKNGSYLTVGGRPGKLIQLVFFKIFAGLFSSKRLHLLALKPNEGLDIILEKIKKSDLQKCMDGPYNFDQIPWAVQYFGNGLHSGKVIISIKHDD